jgi:hypothetical protein
MKKLTIGLLCLTGAMLGFFLSCEIPQSVTIKGQPGVYIPLGNPLNGLDEDQRLENYISTAKIREMMDSSGTTSNLAIYDYRGYDDPTVQTYIVHYPITELKLDLSEYINDVVNDDNTTFSYTIPTEITTISADLFISNFPNGAYLTGNGPQDVEGAPLFLVSLVDMAKLVKEVNGGPFGLEMDLGIDSSFKENIWVKIPAFGINDYVQGIAEGGKLKFAKTPVDGKFIPKQQPEGHLNENDELEIFVKATGICSGTIAPDIVFEWTTAIIDTSDNDSLKGEFQLENSLGEFLGNSVHFKDVQGFIYVNGVDSATTLTLTVDGTTLGSANQTLLNKSRPALMESIIELPAQSLAAPIPLASLLNSNAALGYQFKIPEMTITNNVDLGSITVDLVVLLPLDFMVTAQSSMPDYVKLDLGDIFPDTGNDDLFFREGKGDDLFDNLESVTILLKNVQNTVIESKISILVTDSDGYSGKFDLTEGGKLELEMDDLPYPFNPRFEIILEKDDGAIGKKDYATLKILREILAIPRIFEFSLALEAQADINYKIKF